MVQKCIHGDNLLKFKGEGSECHSFRERQVNGPCVICTPYPMSCSALKQVVLDLERQGSRKSASLVHAIQVRSSEPIWSLKNIRCGPKPKMGRFGNPASHMPCAVGGFLSFALLWAFVHGRVDRVLYLLCIQLAQVPSLAPV